MEEKYLPVGSVCMLKGGQKAVMVVGYGIQPKEEPNVIYDYLGALYPEGIVTMEQNMVFNHDNIDKVLFKGYETDEQKGFNQKIVEVINQMKTSGGMTTGTVGTPASTAPAQATTNDFNDQKVLNVESPIPTVENAPAAEPSVETLDAPAAAAPQASTSYVPPFSPFGNQDNNAQ